MEGLDKQKEIMAWDAYMKAGRSIRAEEIRAELAAAKAKEDKAAQDMAELRLRTNTPPGQGMTPDIEIRRRLYRRAGQSTTTSSRERKEASNHFTASLRQSSIRSGGGPFWAAIEFKDDVGADALTIDFKSLKDMLLFFHATLMYGDAREDLPREIDVRYRILPCSSQENPKHVTRPLFGSRRLGSPGFSMGNGSVAIWW